MDSSRVATMRLLKKPSQYVLALCAYLANAVHASYPSIHRAGSLQRHTADFGVVLPLLIGVSLVILLIPAALRHTSSLAEKTVVIVTGILLVLCVIGHLHVLGLHWAVLPHGDLIFLITSWLATILAAVLTLEVFKGEHSRPK